MFYILDDQGNPIPEICHKRWLKWMTAHDWRVAYDIAGDLQVSTVFLGIHHGLGHIFDTVCGPPIVFETMIFQEDNMDELYMKRYSTLNEAVEGHKTALAIAEELRI